MDSIRRDGEGALRASGRPTRATIDLRAIRANFAEARRRADGRELMAVVKADAYGHGAIRVSQTLVEAGCRWFAVATVAEGADLRDAGHLKAWLCGIARNLAKNSARRRGRDAMDRAAPLDAVAEPPSAAPGPGGAKPR